MKSVFISILNSSVLPGPSASSKWFKKCRGLILPFAMILLLSSCSGSSQGPSSSGQNLSPPPQRTNPTGDAPDPVRRTIFDNPCMNESTATARGRETLRAFSDQETRYQLFVQNIGTNVIQAIDDWIRNTATFADLPPGTSINIVGIPNDGRFNLGVYRATRADTGANFVVKLVENSPTSNSTGESEADHLWKLQDSIVMHPGCLVRSGRLTGEQQQLLPHLTRILESSFFDVGATRRQILLLEAARGRTARTELEDLERRGNNQGISEIQYRLGRSIGTFHTVMRSPTDAQAFPEWGTWTHGDPLLNNVFYDSLTQSFTWIDLGQLDNGPNPSLRMTNDIDQSLEVRGRFPTYDANARMNQYLGIFLLTPEDRSRDLTLEPTADLNPRERAALTWMHREFRNPPLELSLVMLGQLGTIRSSGPSHYDQVDRQAQSFNAYVAGYLAAVPTHLRGEVQNYFGQWAAGFAGAAALQTSRSYINDELFTHHWIQVLPPSVTDASEGRFHFQL